MKNSCFKIEGGNQEICFNSGKNGFGWQLFSKRGVEWTPTTSNDNPLIWGPSFNLRAQKINQQSSDCLSLSGTSTAVNLQNKPFAYSWNANIKLLDSDWFKFDVFIDLKDSMRLRYQRESEPQIVFKLPTVSVQEEGSFIWNQVLIANPATDNLGVQSSDLPAVYYYDPCTRSEVMFFLDWESLNWTSNSNIFGFLGGRCGLKSILKRGKDQPLRERYVGFWPENIDYLGQLLPKGQQRFSYYIRSQSIEKQPDQWLGISRFIGQLSPLLKSKKSIWKGKYSWTDFAKKCFQDLAKEEMSQIKLTDKETGLRAYAQIGDFASSNPPSRVELMTQVDVLWPLFHYLRLQPDTAIKHLYEKLFLILPGFFNQKKLFLANWYPLDDQLMCQDEETWYFLENGLIKFGWIAFLSGDKTLKSIYIKFCQKIIGIARDCGYLFPLRYDWQNEKAHGERKNFAAAGLYSYGMCLLSELTSETKFLTEAEVSLRTIRQLPLDWLFHEPQQLSYAAAASYRLFKKTGSSEFREWAWEFIAQQLRMFYWYTDKSLKKELNCDCAGMVRSFPSKIYPVVKQNPAFKENVESILPWIILLGDEKFTRPLLMFLNLARRNNFYFFDTYQKVTDPCFIPLESLPALRASGSRHRGGGVGHAIYGAGEAIWLYLLFEAFAEASVREIMTMRLDYLEPSIITRLDGKQDFIVYNPTEVNCRFRLKFKQPPGGECNVFLNGKETIVKDDLNRLGIELVLGSQAYSYVTISNDSNV
ncbi:MAG TPA: hypothetical protein VMW41_04625 [Candidatus Bathyarchaeia archaeon]|nr:hypothetical protein [Candidatus Bathyarchaeia archaeon]